MSETRKILPYLRNPFSRRDPPAGRLLAAPSGNSSGALNAISAGWVIGFMTSAGLLENAGDDLVERRILDAHVDDRMAIENDTQDLAHPRALHLQVHNRPFAAGDLTEALQIRRHAVAVKMQLDQLRLAEHVRDLGQRPVV